MKESAFLVVLLSSSIFACGPIGSEGKARDVTGSGGSGGPGSGSGGGPGSGGGAGAGPMGTGGSGPDAGGVPPGDDSGPDAGSIPPGGGYYVNGNTIYDGQGRPHLFHGLDRPSMEWNPSGERLSASDYALMASWKANVVRLSLNQGYWLPGSSVYAAGYERIVEQNVANIKEAGMDVILDLHWSDRGDMARTPAQQRMADANSVTFWKSIAEKFKGDGRVLFELYNEPHDVPWDVWRNGGPSGDGFTVAGMQALYDAVRSTGAQNLVLIGGLRFGYDLSGIPQYRIRGHNIVYASHPYNFPDKQAATWTAAWGFLTTTDPVMVTEFGDTTGDCAATYYKQVIDYANSRGISWSGWAWFVAECKFPSLIADWAGTPTTAGQVVKSALLAY